MGYDMQWLTVPASEKQAVDDASRRFLASSKMRAEAELALGEDERATYWKALSPSIGFEEREALLGGATDAVRRLLEAEEELRRLRDALSSAEKSSFRLTGSAMQVCCELMKQRGMLDEDLRPGAWPDAAAFDVSDEMREELDEVEDEELEELLQGTPKLRAYHQAVERYFAAGRSPPTGIPAHELSSNDGWLVTPDECRAALGAHAAFVSANGDVASIHLGQEVTWWPRWLAFLEGAASHGGFRVW